MIPALQQAALDPALYRGRAFHVYVFLCTQLDVSEFRPVKINAHCRTLHIKRPQLSHAINLLIERGYIEARMDENDERRRVYRLFYSIAESERNSAA